jgi:hypothetical protein
MNTASAILIVHEKRLIGLCSLGFERHFNLGQLPPFSIVQEEA